MNPPSASVNRAPSKVRPDWPRGRHLQMQIFLSHAFLFGIHIIFRYLLTGQGLCRILGNTTTSTSQAICKAGGTQPTPLLLPEFCQRRQYLFVSVSLFFRHTRAMLTLQHFRVCKGLLSGEACSVRVLLLPLKLFGLPCIL